ncbi:anti-sigma factor antagonist [Lentzea pudingi]|uniref:Anti-sigma factor antagonist n=2 Tax=Lentzea pudingi TaxID=1789439 RepID=A0ABQ2HXM1_9PSEU|nr:anti-sigma factor antagonist [Lentzea pudingi]
MAESYPGGMTSPAGDFRVTAAHTSQTLVITVSGELDSATAGELAEHLDRVAAGSGPLVVDMTGVTFCDSSGLNCLMAAVARDVDLRIIGSRQVLKVLRLAGVMHAVTLEPSVARAIGKAVGAD